MNGGKYAPPVWTIDGAPFQVDIPTFQMWQSVKQLWKPDKTKRLTLTDYRDNFLLRAQAKMVSYGMYLVNPESKANLQGEFDDNNKKIAMYIKFLSNGEQVDELITLMGCGFVFTVCLTPLDSNGEDDSFQFSMDNPDGSVIHGGSLYINEKPIIGVQCFNPWTRVPDGQSVYVGDTYSTAGDLATLEWVVYDGKLMAPYNLFTLSHKDIRRVFNGYRKCW